MASGFLAGLKRLLTPRVEAFGLEVGAASLKAVELAPGDPPRLLAYGERPTPEGALHEGVITDPGLLAQEIRELLLEARIRKRFVVTAVPNASLFLRAIQIPKMSPKEMEEAVRWEAERYIPFPLDEVTLDFAPLNPLEEAAEGEQAQVMVAAVRNETVMGLLEALKGAGLTPLVLDVKPFAGLYPIEALLQAQPDRVSVALEIGAETTSLTLLRGDRPLAVRILPLAGRDFTQAIARAFGLDLLTAEEVKKTYGLATIPTEDEELLLDFDAERERYSPAKIYDAIRPVLVDLTREVRQSLDFFRMSLGEGSPEVGYLLGGGARLRGIGNLLADTLGFPFEGLDPWKALSLNGGKATELESLGPSFAVPVGLAMRGVRPFD